MPKLSEQMPKLKKITVRVDSVLAEQINNATAKLGVQTEAEFIRLSVAEKVNAVLGQRNSKHRRPTNS